MTRLNLYPTPVISLMGSVNHLSWVGTVQAKHSVVKTYNVWWPIDRVSFRVFSMPLPQHIPTPPHISSLKLIHITEMWIYVHLHNSPTQLPPPTTPTPKNTDTYSIIIIIIINYINMVISPLDFTRTNPWFPTENIVLFTWNSVYSSLTINYHSEMRWC